MDFGPASPFTAISAVGMAVVVGTYVFAFVVKGVFGYGAIPPIILSTSLLLGPHNAIILAALVNVVTQLFMLPEGLREGDRDQAFRVIVMVLPAIVVGVWIFNNLRSDSLQVAVGVLILMLLLLERTPLHQRLVPYVTRKQKLFSAASAVLAGLTAGVVGAGAMLLLSIYLRVVITDSLRFRATVILILTVIVAWRTAMLAFWGLVTPPLVMAAAVLLPVSIISSYAGRTIARRVSSEVFFISYQVFLIAAAALLILQAII